VGVETGTRDSVDFLHVNNKIEIVVRASLVCSVLYRVDGLPPGWLHILVASGLAELSPSLCYLLSLRRRPPTNETFQVSRYGREIGL